MKLCQFYDALDALEKEGLPYDVVEVGEGYRLVRFDVQDPSAMGKKLLSKSTNGDVIEYADSVGYVLSESDCVELRKHVSLFGKNETVAEAVDDFLEAYEA